MMAEPVEYGWQSDVKVLFDAIVEMFGELSNTDEDATIKNIVVEKKAMSKAYKNKILDIEANPKFSDKLRRWTYIYTYLPRHVHLVYAALMKVHELEHTESLNKLKDGPIVCCVGGGPNTDALGLCIFLRAVGCEYPLTTKVCILDKYLLWSQTWEDMKRKLSGEYQSWMPETKWVKFDLFKEITDKSKEQLRNADIITMIKALSPLAALLETLKVTCDRIMKMMKPNALLLFIDNEYSKAGDLLLEARREFNENSHKVLHNSKLKADLDDRNAIFSDGAEVLISRINDQPVLTAGGHIVMSDGGRELFTRNGLPFARNALCLTDTGTFLLVVI